MKRCRVTNKYGKRPCYKYISFGVLQDFVPNFIDVGSAIKLFSSTGNVV